MRTLTLSKKSTCNMVKLFLLTIVTIWFTGCKEYSEDLAAPDDPVLEQVGKSHLKSVTVNTFKVMSFNIRQNSEEDPYTLEERKESIRDAILNNGPDIFGLQENHPKSEDETFKIMDWLDPEMKDAGYLSSYMTTKIIYYKSSRFTKQSQGFFYIGTTQGARWMILYDNVTDKEYFVLNTHWYYASQATRIANANALVDSIPARAGSRPKIIFGDLNAEPGTTEIGILRDAFDLVCTHNETGNTFHGWDATGDKKLDWVFISRDLAYTASSIISTQYDGKWPSDHWPIMATITPAVFGGGHDDPNGTSGVSSTRFYFADVTGDGKDDKIYWRPDLDNGHPRVYQSDGDGTFTFKLSHTASASTLSTTFYYFADINGDGKADLIKWDRTQESGHTRVYLTDANGNFSDTPVINSEGGSQSSSTTYYFADVTGDGKADKIYWNPTYDTGNTRTYVATSGGNFSSTVVSSGNGSSESSNTKFFFADVTGDGKADKIYWNIGYDEGHIRVFGSDGDGNFTYLYSNTSGSSQSSNTRHSFADFNDDGMADMVYWNYGNYKGKVKVYFSNGGAGSFGSPVYTLRGTSEDSYTQYFFSDINGDGKADQIRWNYAQNSGALRNYFSNY